MIEWSDWIGGLMVGLVWATCSAYAIGVVSRQHERSKAEDDAAEQILRGAMQRWWFPVVLFVILVIGWMIALVRARGD